VGVDNGPERRYVSTIATALLVAQFDHSARGRRAFRQRFHALRQRGFHASASLQRSMISSLRLLSVSVASPLSVSYNKRLQLSHICLFSHPRNIHYSANPRKCSKLAVDRSPVTLPLRPQHHRVKMLNHFS
jgi:hypothetical protein